MIINRIAVLNYRCLRYVDLPLERFHLLVGPNASGKSTLLDAIHFLKDLMTVGLDQACEIRSKNFLDLVWQRDKKKPWFEILVEFNISESLRQMLPEDKNYSTFQYAVQIALGKKGKPHILREIGRLISKQQRIERQVDFFPQPQEAPQTLIKSHQKGTRAIVKKTETGKDNFYRETSKKAGKGWVISFDLGLGRSVLGNLPMDRVNFPVATTVATLLKEELHAFQLDSVILRQASPPRHRADFATSGASLPWAVKKFQKENKEDFYKWIGHLREALPDLKNIRAVERPDDSHCYLVLEYENGLKVPSWVISDGTLRLIALTLLAYWHEQPSGFFLIEEPENGIHPKAVQTVFDSLSSVYDHQVMLATHSPVVLSEAEIKDVLCFAKDENGATDIVHGNDHPRLREWKREKLNLGDLFAAGILG